MLERRIQQDKLSKELSNLADNSSSLLQQIAEMNSKISKAMALGQPTAELSDARENLVTELSGYLGVDITDVGDGNLNISSKNGAPTISSLLPRFQCRWIIMG